MTLSTFALIQALALMLSAILTAWYRPSWLRGFASFLLDLTDAIQAARAVFQSAESKSTPKGKPTLVEPDLTPVQAEVLSALINQGASRSKARLSLAKAVASLPADAGFDALFLKAVAA
jgi:hypothetical protein